MYFLLIAPCGKGTQESLGFWIPGSGFQSLSGKLGFWIPFVCGIPDSLSCLPDSKVQDFGFYLAGLNFPRSRIPKTKVSRILEFRIALHLARLTWRCLILFEGAYESWYYMKYRLEFLILVTLRSDDATAAKTSLQKWTCVLSVFNAIIPTHLLCQM